MTIRGDGWKAFKGRASTEIWPPLVRASYKNRDSVPRSSPQGLRASVLTSKSVLCYCSSDISQSLSITC